ncbi:hypothetical protein FQN54_006237 [Arachnomyces sp. PD_36]|nr:hypothetical protein FQN54_006237 [Arachnomyces sp. PD_36]
MGSPNIPGAEDSLPPALPESTPHRKHHGKKPPNPQNPTTFPLRAAVHTYLTTHLPPSHLPSLSLTPESLTSTLPKRYTIYPPLLLLPAHTFTSTPDWETFYLSLTETQRQDLYASIVSHPAFGKAGVTHLAMNAPIRAVDGRGLENRMRSPTGLVPLYGDFGRAVGGEESGEGEGEGGDPSEEELREAFWVRTTQNGGIVQIWAPLYTMFSRGNVVEKARILGAEEGRVFEGLDERSLGEKLGDVSVVDMYAGIGYFVFSYLRRGVGRVWGWEINGWSVEGLRRGCRENGWGVRVLRVGGDGEVEVEGGIRGLVEGLSGEERVVVFHGDNRFVGDVMLRVKREMEERREWKKVRHVNLGLLPTSRPAWDGAVRVLDQDTQGWLHVHENVDVKEIEDKKEQIVKELGGLVFHHRGESSTSLNARAECRHVERVKSYAPGVMHCVFDVYIPPTSTMLVDSGKSEEKNKDL